MLVRSLSVEQEDFPLIAYDQVVTETNVVADTANAAFPISRVANWETHLYWMAADNTTQYVTVTTDGVAPVEFVALAGHNLGTAGITVSVEKFLSGAWINVGASHLPDDDRVIIWQMSPQVMAQFRVKFVGGSTPAQLAVLMAGDLLIMERGIYSRHVPITYGFKTDVANGFSNSGQFLGRIIEGETRESAATFRLLTPSWFRANIPPFMEAAQEHPFVFVWRPDEYPEEVGFVVLTEDINPMPEDASSNNLVTFDVKMEGVAP